MIELMATIVNLRRPDISQREEEGGGARHLRVCRIGLLKERQQRGDQRLLAFHVSGFGFRASGFGKVSGFGFHVLGFGVRISSFGIWGSGFKVQVSSSAFRVWGSLQPAPPANTKNSAGKHRYEFV